MTEAKARQIVLAARPQGRPKLTDFRLEETAIPTPSAGQVLLRVEYLSLDPYMRGRMDDRKSYAKPVPLGGVMQGESVATVIASQHPGYSGGDIVLAQTGWRTHALSDRADLRKLDPAVAPVTTGLGVLGMPGFTAYSGLRVIGKPAPGETVVVAAASGPVGQLRRELKNGHGENAVSLRSVGRPLVTGDLSTEAKVSTVLARLLPRARPEKARPTRCRRLCPGLDLKRLGHEPERLHITSGGRHRTTDCTLG